MLAHVNVKLNLKTKFTAFSLNREFYMYNLIKMLERLNVIFMKSNRKCDPESITSNEFKNNVIHRLTVNYQCSQD